jgi:hypothetical protein
MFTVNRLAKIVSAVVFSGFVAGCASTKPHLEDGYYIHLPPYTLPDGVIIESWEQSINDSGQFEKVSITYRTSRSSPSQTRTVRTGDTFFGYRVGTTTGRGETIGDPRVALAGVIITRTILTSASRKILLEDVSGTQRVLVR